MNFRDRLNEHRKSNGVRTIAEEKITTAQSLLDDLQLVASEQEEIKASLEKVRSEMEIEHNARATVFKMIQSVPELEKEFSFNTARFGGEAYVQAMRQVLSRAREDARERGTKLQHFKFFLVSIDHHPTHDRVTVMRSTHSSLRTKRVADGLVSLLAEKGA